MINVADQASRLSEQQRYAATGPTAIPTGCGGWWDPLGPLCQRGPRRVGKSGRCSCRRTRRQGCAESTRMHDARSCCRLTGRARRWVAAETTSGALLKHGTVVGSLRHIREAAVPVLDAVGGMARPAGVFVTVELGLGDASALHEWAIPTATTSGSRWRYWRSSATDRPASHAPSCSPSPWSTRPAGDHGDCRLLLSRLPGGMGTWQCASGHSGVRWGT